MECIRGHEYTDENTYINRRGARECRTCRRSSRKGPRAKVTSAERLLAKITVLDNGCWVWTGDTDSKGYGRITCGQTWATHRLAWTIWCGLIPKGMQVCHHCDCPPCCNPDHLFLGTQKDNMVDMVTKGRNYQTTKPEAQARWERNGGAKTTWKEVVEMRRLHESGVMQKEIAETFGLGTSQVNRIVRGLSWRPFGGIGGGA